MYNKTFLCTYLEKDSIETYQEELLKAIGCESVNELVPAIEHLYETVKNDEIAQLIQKITQMTGVNEDLAFYILFSFDFFSYMHAYLVEPSTFPILYDKIKV
jgi:hypothetical protein